MALNKQNKIKAKKKFQWCAPKLNFNFGYFVLSQKGQASVADALAFFLVATSLALFLFSFGTSYGSGFNEQVSRKQFTEYTSSALKVIEYTSLPRNPACTLETCPDGSEPEVDFLLAAVKEDFADDDVFNETHEVLKNNIAAIMKPLSDSSDYVFFFQSDDLVNEFPYFLWYKSEFELSRCPGAPAGQTGCHQFYYCKPQSERTVSEFLFSIPNISKTASVIKLPAVDPASSRPEDSEVHFAVWSSTKVSDDWRLPTKLDCCLASDSTCTGRQFLSPTSSGGLGIQIQPASATLAKPPGSSSYGPDRGYYSFRFQAGNQPVNDISVTTGSGCTGISLSGAMPFSLVSRSPADTHVTFSITPTANPSEIQICEFTVSYKIGGLSRSRLQPFNIYRAR